MVADETAWADREFTGHDFREEDLSRLRTERVVFTECDFSGVDMSESAAFRLGVPQLHLSPRHAVAQRVPPTAACWDRCSPSAGCGRIKIVEVGPDPELCSAAAICAASTCRTAGCVRPAWSGWTCARRCYGSADLTGARVQDAKLDEADLRGARVDPTFWTTAKLRGAKIDIAQALAYSAAHGLDVHGG